MMANPGKEAALTGLHAYRAKLREEMARLLMDVRAVERSIELLSGQDGGGTADSLPMAIARPMRLSSGYADLKPQQAAQRLLREEKRHWFKASVAARELIRRGCPKKSKHFATIIAAALNRLADKGIAEKAKRGGVWMYRLKKEPDSMSVESGS